MRQAECKELSCSCRRAWSTTPNTSISSQRLALAPGAMNGFSDGTAKLWTPTGISLKIVAVKNRPLFLISLTHLALILNSWLTMIYMKPLTLTHQNSPQLKLLETGYNTYRIRSQMVFTQLATPSTLNQSGMLL